MPTRPDRSPNSSDPLSREVEAALEGVNLQELDESGRMPRKGSAKSNLVKGTVVGTSGDDVIVELGPRAQGVIKKTEFEELPQIGAVFEFSMHGMEDGLHLLSRKEAKALAAWDELSLGARVEARVTGQNTGGLELKVGPISAFMPASQVSLGREDDLHRFLGNTFECEVIELDPSKKRIVLSRRKVLESARDESRKQLMGALTPGQLVTGKVTRVESFGAFVDIGGGVEALLHVSQISRKRVENAADALKTGDQVRAMILEIKEGGKRIGIGTKQLEADPWDEASNRVGVGQVLTGKIVRLMEFGAFVELLPGIEGLLHVSQISKERVRKVQDVLKLGSEVSVRVLNVDSKQKRISLSRMDERGAVIGSEDSVEGAVIQEMLDKQGGGKVQTNLGSLFKKALEQKKK
ncbi:MAG: S1 RNA-binding domain-containing protein [Planctomycetes bacterium]|nr:S1 RNA-binding domain-containing protein [Planctomycetota bacterium]